MLHLAFAEMNSPDPSRPATKASACHLVPFRPILYSHESFKAVKPCLREFLSLVKALFKGFLSFKQAFFLRIPIVVQGIPIFFKAFLKGLLSSCKAFLRDV